MKMQKRIVTLLAVLFFAVSVSAQSVEAVGQKYNQAIELVKAKNYSKAIPVLKEAIALGEKAGDAAASMVESAKSALISSYLKQGITLYKKKKFTDAVNILEEGKKVAEKYNDTKSAKKFGSVIPQVLYGYGNSLLKQKKYDEALAQFDKAIGKKPTCIKAFFGKEAVYKEKGDYVKMAEYTDKAIQLGKTNSKYAGIAAKAKKMAYLALYKAGGEELTKGNASKAIKYFNEALTYGEGDADLYLNTALAYNSAKNFSKGVEAATKALELKKQGDKNGIYFVLAQAYEGKGDNANACKYYKMVKQGPNVDAAKYQMEQVLKCK
jgi:tetratricopeptide (TPR) repeat protein